MVTANAKFSATETRRQLSGIYPPPEQEHSVTSKTIGYCLLLITFRYSTPTSVFVPTASLHRALSFLGIELLKAIGSNTNMDDGGQDTNLSLVFGIMGTLIAFTALLVAFLQLRRAKRIYRIYELA